MSKAKRPARSRELGRPQSNSAGRRGAAALTGFPPALENCWRDLVDRPRIGLAIFLLLGLLVGGAYLIFERTHMDGWGFPLDDPWIHFQFARNIADGHGFALNAGEPVSGSTSPLWTLLLAGVHLVAWNTNAVALAAKLIGILLLGVSGYLGGQLLRCWGASAGIAAFGGVALLTMAPLGWGAVSGLEVSLYVALSLGALLAGQDIGTFRRRLLTSALFALAVYARPECLVLLGIYVLDRALLGRESCRWKHLFQVSLLSIIWMVPYALLNYSLSGVVFPHTFRVKVGGGGLVGTLSRGEFSAVGRLLYSSGPSYVGDLIGHLFRSNPLLPWGVLAGFFLVTPRLLRGERRTLLPILIVLLYAYLLGVAAPFRGAAFQGGRYIANLVALAALLGVWGWSELVRQIRIRAATGGFVIAVLLIAAGVFNQVTAGASTARNAVRSAKSIAAVQVHLGHWLRDNTPADAVVATNDIGAISYFSERRVLDLAGLANPDVVPYLREHRGIDPAAKAYLRKAKPDYLVLFPRWFPTLIMSTPHVFETRVDYLENTASEWTFFPRAETIAGVLLTRIVVDATPTTMIVLRPDWEAPPLAGPS